MTERECHGVNLVKLWKEGDVPLSLRLAEGESAHRCQRCNSKAILLHEISAVLKEVTEKISKIRSAIN